MDQHRRSVSIIAIVCLETTLPNMIRKQLPARDLRVDLQTNLLCTRRQVISAFSHATIGASRIWYCRVTYRLVQSEHVEPRRMYFGMADEVQYIPDRAVSNTPSPASHFLGFLAGPRHSFSYRVLRLSHSRSSHSFFSSLAFHYHGSSSWIRLIRGVPRTLRALQLGHSCGSVIRLPCKPPRRVQGSSRRGRPGCSFWYQCFFFRPVIHRWHLVHRLLHVQQRLSI